MVVYLFEKSIPMPILGVGQGRGGSFVFQQMITLTKTLTHKNVKHPFQDGK